MGIGCGTPGYPGVYARVSTVVEWINNNLEESGPKCPGAINAWWGDKYCDDFMNTPECGFDGGDCCPDRQTMNQGFWNNYCTACDRRKGCTKADPNSGPTCEDS